MEDFLAGKAKKPVSRHIIIITISAAFFVAGVSVAVKEIHGGEGELWATGFWIAFFAFFGARSAIQWIRQIRARKFAVCFAGIRESCVSLEKLRAMLPMPQMDRRLRRLLHSGYLKNVTVDLSRNAVELTVGNQHVRDAEIREMECPNCGAKNLVRSGRVNRCAYCDSALIGDGGRGD